MKTAFIKPFIILSLFALLLVQFTALSGVAIARSGFPDVASIDSLH